MFVKQKCDAFVLRSGNTSRKQFVALILPMVERLLRTRKCHMPFKK